MKYSLEVTKEHYKTIVELATNEDRTIDAIGPQLHNLIQDNYLGDPIVQALTLRGLKVIDWDWARDNNNPHEITDLRFNRDISEDLETDTIVKLIIK